MSVNEIIWGLKRSECDKKFIRDKVIFVFFLPFKFLTPDLNIFLESVRIMEVYNLSFSDSVISAHAIVDELKLATLDRDFRKVSELEVFGIE
ncbi:MAG: PIN domain-containing protein [Theionarchaea archaeon]|nr:PIN domain-containing protein [Theionarchaea archaeon]